MGRGVLTGDLLCPGCGTTLEPLGSGDDGGFHRMLCRGCGETFRARRRPASPPSPPPPGESSQAPAGSLSLIWRGAALRGVEMTYRAGVAAGSAALLACGGFVPVVSAWLRDEIDDWGGVLETLGGVHVVTETRDPDADLGPVLAFTDAPLLFSAVNEVARRLGVRSPGQIRLTYLPCCGVVAWGQSQALILGLPLLRVLTTAELRAIIAHELAHLARGDATRAARSARFVQGLNRALDRVGGRGRGPLGAWARGCSRLANALIGPIARGQEARADRSAATIAGGGATASALVKVAVVQPLFREVLEHYDPNDPGAVAPNLYAFFRAFWYRLSPEVHSALRLGILAASDDSSDPAHPPLPHRLAQLRGYPDPAGGSDSTPANAFLGDLEGFEQMLHNRLFGLTPVEPSVFHRSGT